MKCIFALILAQLFTIKANSQKQVEDGRKIFARNCTNCHVESKPDVVPLNSRAIKHTNAWFSKWISNLMKLIAEKDKEAVSVYNEYNKVPHPAFMFKKQEMESLIVYWKTQK